MIQYTVYEKDINSEVWRSVTTHTHFEDAFTLAQELREAHPTSYYKIRREVTVGEDLFFSRKKEANW